MDRSIIHFAPGPGRADNFNDRLDLPENGRRAADKSHVPSGACIVLARSGRMARNAAQAAAMSAHRLNTGSTTECGKPRMNTASATTATATKARPDERGPDGRGLTRGTEVP